jgi:hypothetical protein
MTRKQFALGWIALAAAMTAPLALLNVPRFASILIHQRVAQGEVSDKDCARHATVSYKFQIDGKTFDGAGASLAGGCETARIGQPLAVYFDARDPNVNMGREPRAALWNEIMSIALVALLLPPFVLLILDRRSSRRTR